MKIWALTGGIASGKTTVAEALRAHSVAVVGADAIYHGLLAPSGGRPSPLVAAIAEAFGAAVVGADGSLQRRALGARVFADESLRRRLEAICHPAIADAAAAAFASHAQGGQRVGIYDVPLLFERGLEGHYAGVAVVWVPRHLQIERLRARDGLDAAAIEQRLAAQLPLDDKRARADVVIDNSGSRAATHRQVDAWVGRLGAAPSDPAPGP